MILDTSLFNKHMPLCMIFCKVRKTPKDLTWHANGKNYEMLRHLADSSQWKKIDCLYPDFCKEARNLRLGLATDGMNPYDSLSTQHSSWPVLLVIYNLPPWLCMK